MAKDCSIEQGSNFANVTVGKLTIAFSYNTVIGFHAGHGWVVRQNSWGPTTGKHLNALDGGKPKDRLSGSDFENALDGALKQFKLI